MFANDILQEYEKKIAAYRRVLAQVEPEQLKELYVKEPALQEEIEKILHVEGITILKKEDKITCSA